MSKNRSQGCYFFILFTKRFKALDYTTWIDIPIEKINIFKTQPKLFQQTCGYFGWQIPSFSLLFFIFSTRLVLTRSRWVPVCRGSNEPIYKAVLIVQRRRGSIGWAHLFSLSLFSFPASPSLATARISWAWPVGRHDATRARLCQGGW